MTNDDYTAVNHSDQHSVEDEAAATAALGEGEPFKSRRIKLSPAVAKNAPTPPARDYVLWDSLNGGLGFGLRIYPSGAKSWICQKKQSGRPVRIKIGSFPATTYTKALQAAKRVNVEFMQGLNPNIEKKKRLDAAEEAKIKAALTVSTAFMDYQEAKKGGSARSDADRKKAGELLESGKLWRRPLLEITGEELHEEYNRLITRSKKGSNNGRTQAGAAMRWLRAAYTYAVTKKRLNPANPFHVLNELSPGWYRTQERKRIIADLDHQLEHWWKAVEKLRTKDKPDDQQEGKHDGRMRHAATIADYLQLSLLFGSRKSELLPLKWSDVDLANGVVTFPETKNGKAHVIPFGPFARSIFERRSEANERKSPYVFPSSRSRRDGTYSHIQQPQNTLDWVIKESGVQFSPHDLRRTFATLAEELGGITTATLERLLNHAPSTVHAKNYVHQRMSRLRPLYERLENLILIEAGVMPPNATTPALTPDVIASIRAAALETDEEQKESLDATPSSATKSTIQVRPEGQGYIATGLSIHGQIDAFGSTPQEAVALLKASLSS